MVDPCFLSEQCSYADIIIERGTRIHNITSSILHNVCTLSLVSCLIIENIRITKIELILLPNIEISMFRKYNQHGNHVMCTTYAYKR